MKNFLNFPPVNFLENVKEYCHFSSNTIQFYSWLLFACICIANIGSVLARKGRKNTDIHEKANFLEHFLNAEFILVATCIDEMKKTYWLYHS